MLNSYDILEKMKTHFPRWMDIRKRVSKSNGGKIITSIAEETANIQLAIDEYKKDFFIDRFAGREDSVVAFVYKLHVGSITTDELKILTPALDFTTDIKEFYSSTGKALFQDNCLFFRTEDINENSPYAKYALSDYITTGVPEKIHVWNIFDEFAVFVGLTRHQWESNIDLEKRILSVNKNKPNSSEEGLKNAIYNELFVLDPKLTKEEIVIEPPTAKNLIKYYEKFGSVVEKLAQINRDVYRTKRWNLDTWNYSFKSVDYIPHAWDVVLDSYKNGVGFDDDIKTVITDVNDTVNARVNFYQKSNVILKDYVTQNEVKTNINLQLSKYDNLLKPLTAKYKITASDTIDITDKNILLECKETVDGESTVNIQDVVTSDTRDIQVVDKTTIDANKNYKLVFTPKSDNTDMKIQQCDLITNGSTTSLLKEKNEFAFDSNHVLYNKNVKLYATQRYSFSAYDNVINLQDGMMLDDLSKPGSLSMALTGMANQPFVVKSFCNMTTVPSTNISMLGFEVNTAGQITSINSSGDKYVELLMSANEIAFDVVEGNYTIDVTVDGATTTTIGNGMRTFSTGSSNTPKQFKVKITPIGESKVTLRNCRYTNFEINYTFDVGNVVLLNGQTIIPDTPDNVLTISIKTNTGYSPIIQYLYVGSSIANAKYETDIIPSAALARRLVIKTDCNITLQEVDAVGKVLSETPNYLPHYEYKALSDQAYIRLDMSSYSNIDSMKLPVGHFETIGTDLNIQYYIRLKSGEIASLFTVNGKKLVNVKQVSLIEALGVHPESGDRVYISTLINAFAIVNGSNQILKTITQDSVGTNVASIELKNVPEDINCVFATMKSVNIITPSYTGSFKTVYLVPKNPTDYIAYNQTKMIVKTIGDIEIVDVFDPFLPTNKLMAYTVVSMNAANATNVKFDKHGVDFQLLNSWSIGKGTLRLISNVIMTNTTSYELNSTMMSSEFSLRENIGLNRTYTMATGEIVDLAQYIITVPDGMELAYKKKTALQTMNSNPEYYASEVITREEDGFNKLLYSNIDEIIYIGTVPYNANGSNTSLDSTLYHLMDTEGIVVWSTKDIPVGQNIYIVYTIKLPSYIKVSLDLMYKIVEYALDAYRNSGYLDMVNKKSGDEVDLNTLGDYLLSDRITISCDKPGFEATISNGIVRFNKASKDNIVAVKTGYYYSDGQEYFLFANATTDTVDQFMSAEFFNASREDGLISLSKRTRNFINNSYMDIGSIAETFNIDFLESKDINGISKFNEMTACDSFNQWQSFGVTMSLTKGLNGTGIKLDQNIANGYAFIEITDYLLPYSYLSLYCSGSAEVFIGRNKKYQGMNLERSVLIEPIIKLNQHLSDSTILETKIAPEDDVKYYLVVKGSCVIDDIILLDGNLDASKYKNIHTKNIDSYKFDIDEQITKGYISRMYFNNAFNQSEGAEIDKDGFIKNGSTIDWGITKIKDYREQASWTKCITSKVSILDGVCQTKTNPGTLETDPIYIGNVNIIKSLMFEINDVLFDNMKGFITRIKTSNTLTGEYRTVATTKDNMGSALGEVLDKYVKISIDIPAYKVINNISVYVEYKTTDIAAPVEIPVEVGSIVTGVLDTHYSANFKVKGIRIETASNISNVTIQIRGAKENSNGNVWTEWKAIKLDSNFIVKEDVIFRDYRYFQARVTLNGKDTYIKLTSIDLEVIQ